MSNAIAHSLPPPRAMPSMTAMVACGRVRNCSVTAWNADSSSCSDVSSVGSPCNQFDVRVRDEEFGIGRVDDQHAHLVVGRDLLRQAADLSQQRQVQQVDRRMVDGRPADTAVHGDPNELVVVIGHNETLCDPRQELTFPSDRIGNPID